ncbi:type II secretion system protein GspD [Sphingomonas sp. BK069]|uniref:type II secretion system protein GspD n=1 Tax=Sphingomonas sp. BK069 TaxID=2586979 RepID=UPI00161BFDC6|nr:hypothetical protein [Sphingomonas sp. BK069]MBB3345958.1 hypothetical protein [Sphingomonas sp. BK069]
MRKLGPLLALALVAAAPAPPGHVSVQLDAVPVSELVTILYRDVLRVPYVVAPEVSTDRRTVSVRLVAAPTEARAKVVAYLRAMGLAVVSVDGVDQIGAGASQGVVGALGSPSPGIGASIARQPFSAGPAAKREPVDVAVYVPHFRSPSFLSDILRGVLPDLRFGTRPQAQSDASGVQSVNEPDALVFSGSKSDVAHARALLDQLDTEQGELTVRATIYEVQTGRTNQSALSIALSLLGGRLLGGYLAGGPVSDTLVRLRTGNVDAVVSALNSDNRFKVVTSPSVRARSGTEAVLNSGSQVPVLGAVSYQGQNGSTPVQSIEYRDSGVILKVRPTLHRDVIDLDVDQEISSFARTTTGVNASPTLNRRSLTNSLSLRSGELVVMGGLTEDSETATHSGLFKGLIGSRSRSAARTEVLLVLQVTALAGKETSSS